MAQRFAVLAIVFIALGLSCAQRPDAYFPGFHVRPESNWINDPNGPMFDPNNNRYHLWMQYNPYGPTWGNMSWYHVMSKDLVYFQRLGVTLKNDSPYDIGGVFSGSASVFDSGNTLVIVYTCVDVNGTQRQCVATPDDTTDPTLAIWMKSEHNPVVSAGPAPQNGLTNFRDPTTAWATTSNPKGPYRLAVGTSLVGTPNMAAVALYDTPDLTSKYNFTGYLTQGIERSGMYECPDYFPVAPLLATGSGPAASNVFVFKSSNEWVRQDFMTLGVDASVVNGNTRESFTPTCGADASLGSSQACPHGNVGLQNSVVVDFGNWYASKTFWDPQGKRRILWGWIPEDDTNGGRTWQGVQSLPRQVSYDVNTSQLYIAPIADLNALHDVPLTSNALVLNAVTANGAFLCPAINCTNITQQHIEVLLSVPMTSVDSNLLGWRIGINVLTSNVSAATSTFVGLLGPDSLSTDGSSVCMFSSSGAYADFSVTTVNTCRTVCLDDPRCLAWTVVSGASSTCYLMSKMLTWAPENAPVGTNCGTTNRIRFGVDRRSSGTTGSTSPNVGSVSNTFLPDPQQPGNVLINISVYVDHSVIEGFYNGGAGRVASRVYNPFASGVVSLAAVNGDGSAIANVVLRSASVWSMKDIWVVPEPVNPPSGAVAIVITACVVGAFLGVGGAFSLRQLRRERQASKYTAVA